MTPLIALAGSYFVARQMDQGLSDVLGMVTLRHGTDISTWFKIHAFGAQPEYDQSKLQFKRAEDPSSFVVANSCDRYGIDFTPLLKALDDQFGISTQAQTLQEKIFQITPKSISEVAKRIHCFFIKNIIASFITCQIKKTIPLMNFIYSTGPIPIIMKRVLMYGTPLCQKITASVRKINNCFPSTTVLNLLPKIVVVSLSTLMTPTIKLRFHPDQMENLFKESSIPGQVILLTDQNISPFNMGLIGTIKNSARCSLPSIVREPVKVLKGVCVLAAAGAVAYGAITLFPTLIVAHKTALLAGALLAVI